MATEAYLGPRDPHCLAWTRKLDADLANVRRAALVRVDRHSETYLGGTCYRRPRHHE